MEEEHTESFKDGSDLCQQLMDRYANSAAPQHRHLLATAAAMRSNITAESLPLTPPAYFAAAITSLDSASASESLDPTALSALLSFMAIVLPLVPPGGIAPAKAGEAVEVMFKVRRCAQESLEKVFKSLQSSRVNKEASKLVLSVLKSYMPLATTLASSKTGDGSRDDTSSKPEHMEVLHVLNILKLTAPCLSAKVISKVLLEIQQLINSHFSGLTRHVLKTVEAIFEASEVENIVLETENIIVSLASYVSLGDKNPLDTVISAATLLNRALNILHAGQSSMWINNLPQVCSSVVGLLTFEANTASQASNILKDVLKRHVRSLSLAVDTDQTDHGRSQESVEGSALTSTCAVFENALSTVDGIPNEHILSAITVLFLELGEMSFVLMRNIVLKLADLMTHAFEGGVNLDHLQKCIGSAIFAMGPERFLTVVPISLDENSYSNIWLVPILKRYVIGASLAYYVDNIVPLAKSFKQASRKVKKSAISQDLLAQAHELWGLLPSFCRRATDTYQKFACLSDVLITILKKDPSMHENISMALQILVNENRTVLNPKKSEADCYAAEDSLLEFGMLPSYSKKAASRNIKALASCSNRLLRILSDLFVNSFSENCAPLKGAIGCLASISDSSVIKEIFVSLLKRFQFMDSEDKGGEQTSDNKALDNEPNDAQIDSQRHLILEFASSLIEGASSDLLEIIYNLTLNSFQTTNESIHQKAYHTLSKLLEEDTSLCTAQYLKLIDFLLNLKPPSNISCLRSRFACFCTLMIHTVKMSLEEVDSKAFLILNEIILTLKDGNDEARKQAYDVLLDISTSLRDLSNDGPTSPYHKFISMIMGYLSGSSPHIKSGAVSALSVLVYKDIDLCLSVSGLVPSLLSLLQSKALEVIKAVLGFVKVMVSCLQANDLHNFLSDIVTEVLPWSSTSRNHFRSKACANSSVVTVIFEIITRKCGAAAVKPVIPEKYKSFLKTVLEVTIGVPGSVYYYLLLSFGFIDLNFESCLYFEASNNSFEYFVEHVIVLTDFKLRMEPSLYRAFVMQNRHGRSSAVENVTKNDTENIPEESSTKGPKQRKPNIMHSQENDSGKSKKRKREKKFENRVSSLNNPLKTSNNDDSSFAKRGRHSFNKNSKIQEQGGNKKGKGSKYNGPTSGWKRKIKPMSTKDKAASDGPLRASKTHKKGKFKS
ncbi:RRP12-like protein [Senna tora]|uniref:RRP12-like protein n=1 Tax=Senna tora TaxID=362788 RepID=A0A834WD61_9FABA|nr:RRP12-like protein [Senna tora]